MELMIASYNIHSGIGTDGRFDLERIGLVLQEIGADVVALQEVGDFRNKTPSEQHPELLADLLGMHMAFGPNVVRKGRRYGNAILSRLPILKSKNYDLSVGRREPRGALRCDLDLGGGDILHVFALHLGLGIGERRRQEGLLLSSDILGDAVRPDPVVLCGDFNYWGGGPVPSMVLKALHDPALLLDSPRNTYHSKVPFFRLDRMFVDEQVRPLWVHPHRTPLSILASDHLPLVMRFEAPILQPGRETAPVELIR
ncbi:MAG: endonuclease/exonuclease/phosphatase family protein [Myxococcota bacterium]|nr:endonuclease/exonuclease/phosphatase family protein [Myxococcota bacterium]